jgi:GntR family transcriptional regulator
VIVGSARAEADAERPAPLHGRISADIRAAIASGELPVGSSLPSEAELCRRHAVSRGTVRQAIAALRAEGLLAGGRGRPPRVVGGVPSQPLESFQSFSAWAHASGRVPGQRTAEVARRPASAALATALGIEAGEPVVELLRTRLLDGVPVMIERTAFVMDVGRHLLDFDPDSGSIYAHLTACGADLHSARHTFDAVAATQEDAHLLGTAPGAPLLREQRTAYSSGGRALEFSDERYLPGQVTFTVENTMESRPTVLRALPARTHPTRTDTETEGASS